MDKIHVQDLGCFDAVASVIGKSQAAAELFKVVNANVKVRKTKSNVIESFYWRGAPQGYDFWYSINLKINGVLNIPL